MGEIDFDIRKLPIYYGLSLGFSTIIYFAPIITVNTYYSNCSEWYDGLLANAYGEIWTPLYYGVLLGCLFCSWSYYVIAVVSNFVILHEDYQFNMDHL